MNDGSITVMTLVSLPLGYALIKPVFVAWARRLESKPAATLPDPRLERMEQAIEAIAVEVERISEAQRFTTKLLSERGGERDAPPHVVSGSQSR
jgi:hypothetical protein